MNDETIDYNAEFAMMMDDFEQQPENLHEVQQRLRQTMATMRAEGLPVPEDFKKLEAALDKPLSIS